MLEMHDTDQPISGNRTLENARTFLAGLSEELDAFHIGQM